VLQDSTAANLQNTREMQNKTVKIVTETGGHEKSAALFDQKHCISPKPACICFVHSTAVPNTAVTALDTVQLQSTHHHTDY